MMCNQMSNFFQHGAQPRRLGTAHNQVVPYQVFATRDGYVFIAAGNQNLYERLCRAIGREELVDDPRFDGNPARVANREACIGAISAAIAEHDTGPLMAALSAHGVPFSRVNEYENLVEDGQLDALGVIESGRGDAYPEFRIPGLPFHLSGHDPGEPEDAPASASTPGKSSPQSATTRPASTASSPTTSSARADRGTDDVGAKSEGIDAGNDSCLSAFGVQDGSRTRLRRQVRRRGGRQREH